MISIVRSCFWGSCLYSYFYQHVSWRGSRFCWHGPSFFLVFWIWAMKKPCVSHRPSCEKAHLLASCQILPSSSEPHLTTQPRSCTTTTHTLERSLPCSVDGCLVDYKYHTCRQRKQIVKQNHGSGRRTIYSLSKD